MNAPEPPLAVILLGPESSGNHVCCSVLSAITINGRGILGSDLAGLLDHHPKTHDQELFNNVWLGLQPLQEVAQGRPFVTSRSIPCGCHWPAIQAFHEQALLHGYDARVVVIIRELHITALSAGRRGMVGPAAAWQRLDELLGNLPVVWFSYEGLTQIGWPYLRRWIHALHPNATLEPGVLARVADANSKYLPTATS